MSNPHIPIDLPVHDPIGAEMERQAELQAAWDDGFTAAEDGRRYRVVGLVLAALSGAILGAFLTAALVHAAPRAVPDPAPIQVGGHTGRGQLGAPRDGMPVEVLEAEASREVAAWAARVGAPQSEIGTAIESGVVAYAQPSFGDRYLAIPSGPGHRVRICSSPARCLERTSTDAGPALYRQREGRIADVSFVDFAWLCICRPPSVGLLEATIEWVGPGPTPPATDVEP